jgi:hypothetical protein
MAEKEQLTKEKVEHSGLMDFKALYGFAHSWLEEESYDVEEEKYSEKVSGNSRDINIDWKATKTLSDYFKCEVKVTFEVKELVEVEVEIDGKKKKMNKGKVLITIKGTLVRDPESKWDITPGYRFLRDVYGKYIIPGRVDKIQGIIVGNVIGLKEELKAFLELTGRR